MLIVFPGRKEQSSCLARACLVGNFLACVHALIALDICVSDAIQKRTEEHFGSSAPFGTLREQCSASRWNCVGFIPRADLVFQKEHCSRSVPKGTLLPQCSKRNTAHKFLEIGPFLVSFPVFIMTLRKNRYQTGTISLTICLDTRKGQQNNISRPPTVPFTPPSSSTTMTDNYYTNITMVYKDKSIDLINSTRSCQTLQTLPGPSKTGHLIA